MSEGNEILAEDVIKAILEEKKPEYVLDWKTIKGKFDLRHQVISVAIRITNCTFEDEVDLSYAEFKQCVDFSGSIFRKKLNSKYSFYAKVLRCERVTFENETILENSRLCANLNCAESIFKNIASFNSIQCEGYEFFRNVKFYGKETNFIFAKCRSLEFINTIFFGKVDFQQAHVSKGFFLWNTKFHHNANFNGTIMNTFSLKDPRNKIVLDYFPFEQYIDLHRCLFITFEGTKEQQRHVVEKQAPDKFSMDPYLQFEKYYNSIGDDSYAKDVYYEGRKKLRENARHKRNSDINWSKWKLICDYLNCWLVGYGVKMGRTFVYLAILLLLGTFIFWSDDAMSAKSANSKTSGLVMAIEPDLKADFDKEIISSEMRQKFKDNGLTLSENAYVTTEKNDEEWYIYNSLDAKYKAKLKDNGLKIYCNVCISEKIIHRFLYSLDMLLPVDIKVTDDYRFPVGWRGLYAFIHIGMGWILIPLLILSMAGVLRKRGPSEANAQS